MKKIFSIVLFVLVGAGAVLACVKKSSQSSAVSSQKSALSNQKSVVSSQKSVVSSQKELTILVMDSTQALIRGAEVRVGDRVVRSSWDGRLVLQRAWLEDIQRLDIVCDGFDTQPMMVPAEEVSFLIVRLKGNYKAHNSHKGDVYYSYGSRTGASFKTRAASGDMDGMVELSAAMAVDEAMPMPLPSMPVEEEDAGYEPSAKSYAGAANISAGKLTAGEVNDFAKWQLWKSYQQSAVSYQKIWRIEPLQRYTVQVKNQAGYPVANYPVSLTDAKGNTLFQAVTDNTGKAELWGELVVGSSSLVVSPRINGKAAEKWQTIVVDEPCDAPEGVDVVFVFDATGSMGDELRYLQAEMKDVIARSKEATGGLNIRTGAVVYRDHEDEYVTRISRLTDDLSTTQTFIDRQHANGGGDYPEAVPEALMAALNSAGWDAEARARIAFLVLDAPCHEDSATIALLHEQILNAAAQGIRIVPVVCSGLGESGEYLLRSMALATNGTSFFLTDDSGIGHTHLKPQTDSLKVEHLNDMMVRTIVEFSTMPTCEPSAVSDQNSDIEDFIPNPFNAQELESDPTIPHGKGIHYLVDVSGKLLGIYEGEVPTSHLPIGVYFIKSFYDGTWHTRKILVQ